MVALRRLVLLLGPLLGMVGLAHALDGRLGKTLLYTGAGWVLLLDAARSVGLAMDGGPATIAALGAALSVWLYLLLACLLGWRTWHPDTLPGSPRARDASMAQ